MIVSDEMRVQAKALADASRFRLFQHIAEADGPVGVAELTELLGFNHNAIRQHLAVLVDAGLVAESTEVRKVRGRPRKQYNKRADALHAFRSVSGSYERLASLLLRLSTTDAEPYDVGFAAGAGDVVEGQGDSGERVGAEAVGLLVRQLASDGFDPVQRDDELIALQHCPFADVAAESPGVVCELHRGLINGQLSIGAGLVGDLRPMDPHQAGCLVTIEAERAPSA